MQIKLQSYHAKYNQELIDLESEAVQGGFIKLKMVKPCIRARAMVFDQYQILIALTTYGKVAGMLSTAQTKIGINNEEYDVLTFFDARVGRAFRGNRIAHRMVQNFLMHYNRFSIDDYFVTLKSNNKKITNIIKADYRHVSCVEFTYLTVPTTSRINRKSKGEEPIFCITKFNSSGGANSKYCRQYKSLEVWNTYKMYTLEMTEIPFYIDLTIKYFNRLRPSNKLPTKNHPIRTASLFNGDNFELADINEALKDLENDQVGYLNVCCRKGDLLYNTFKPYSISGYNYKLAGSLKIKKNDHIKMDVRCL